MQRGLPHAADPMWKLLMKTKLTLDEKNWVYTAAIPDDVKALNGRPLTITGFIMPLQNEEKQTWFLLSRLTPVCPFCPPGEPNEILEVKAAQPIPFTYDPIRLTGTFRLIDEGAKGLFYQLDKAQPAR
jgi:hypothetical protein